MKKIMFRGEQVEVPFEDADYRLDGEKTLRSRIHSAVRRPQYLHTLQLFMM
jgi:hypothetical protein